MSEFTREELIEFGRKARIVFNRGGGVVSRGVPIGEFRIECVDMAGLWVYWINENDKDVLIYSHNSSFNTHADIADRPLIEKALNTFRRFFILEELADV